MFFADKYELDNAFRKKKPMSVPVSGLLFNILQTIMSDADITDFRRAFPIWTLAGTPNTFPNERDTIDIYAHIRKLKDLLIEYGTSHYKSIQYYLYYAGPRYKRIERRIQQSKEGRSNSAKQGVFDLFAKMAGFHWDKAVEKLLDAMPESEEERIEKERNMAAVKALLDGVTPELEDLLFAVCIEEYREKILGGLISRPLDFRSLGHIAEITLNSVLQRRPNVNAGISPANPLKYKMSQLFPGQEDHNMIILVINRNNFQIHSNKAPIFIYILETHGRPFTPNEIADVMMGIPVGSWKSQQSPALQSNAVTEHGKSEGNNDDNDNNESQIVKERRKIEKQAIRIVQQCVEWGLLSITSLETKKENKLGFIVHDEVEEYFAPAYSGY